MRPFGPARSPASREQKTSSSNASSFLFSDVLNQPWAPLRATESSLQRPNWCNKRNRGNALGNQIADHAPLPARMFQIDNQLSIALTRRSSVPRLQAVGCLNTGKLQIWPAFGKREIELAGDPAEIIIR